jgi:hypothetical protein
VLGNFEPSKIWANTSGEDIPWPPLYQSSPILAVYVIRQEKMSWSGKTATAVNGVLEEQRGTEEFRVLEKQAGTTGNGFLERKNSKCTT